MASSCHCFPKPLPLPPSHFHFHLHLHPIITFYSSLVFSLFLFHQLDAVNASTPNITTSTANATSEFKRIRFHLRRLNKPYLKTIKAFIYILHKLMHFFLNLVSPFAFPPFIFTLLNIDIDMHYYELIAQSPDGDTIDCVPSHLQPAFDHPMLKGQKPLEEPERPKGHNTSRESEIWYNYMFQEWRKSGEECPQGTIPIRRTRKEDVIRADSIARFGRKPVVRRASTTTGHEHAVGYATGPHKYYGAKGSLSVWAPEVATSAEFSLSQMWLLSGSFASGNDLNTIEAGWQVSPQLFGDDRPRFFTYWTNDAYQSTGCYNLYCAGFVQTNNKIVIGAAIDPTSVYNGKQYDITILIWKDPKHGHWWLELGSGVLVGYWPSVLFTHLAAPATMVQFGGEVVNTRPNGGHSWTQMGSGRFPGEGPNRAAYFRNLQVVDWDNNLIPLSAPRLVADHPNCYDIRGGCNREWGNYFYYGGPGRNARCR
ncbi:protein neprosin-like isoform X1 [Carex rostrata]